jgi:hypothetical protein
VASDAATSSGSLDRHSGVVCSGVTVVLSLAGLLERRNRRIAGFAFVIAAASCSCGGGRCSRHTNVWADDVAQLLEAGSTATMFLNNVRNFQWRSETDYTPQWESRTYDLDRLRSADLVLYWMGPHIAHTLVSFGFDGGERVVFSLEIRKERHESFSAIGRILPSVRADPGSRR